MMITPNCRRNGGNPGSQTASSMITTTSISMSTSASTLNSGTTYTELPDRKERFTERTSSGGKEKTYPRQPGENYQVHKEIFRPGFSEEIEADVGQRKDENPLAYNNNKNKYL